MNRHIYAYIHIYSIYISYACMCVCAWQRRRASGRGSWAASLAPGLEGIQRAKAILIPRSIPCRLRLLMEVKYLFSPSFPLRPPPLTPSPPSPPPSALPLLPLIAPTSMSSFYPRYTNISPTPLWRRGSLRKVNSFGSNPNRRNNPSNWKCANLIPSEPEWAARDALLRGLAFKGEKLNFLLVLSVQEWTIRVTEFNFQLEILYMTFAITREIEHEVVDSCITLHQKTDLIP